MRLAFVVACGLLVSGCADIQKWRRDTFGPTSAERYDEQYENGVAPKERALKKEAEEKAKAEKKAAEAKARDEKEAALIRAAGEQESARAKAEHQSMVQDSLKEAEAALKSRKYVVAMENATACLGMDPENPQCKRVKLRAGGLFCRQQLPQAKRFLHKQRYLMAFSRATQCLEDPDSNREAQRVLAEIRRHVYPSPLHIERFWAQKEGSGFSFLFSVADSSGRPIATAGSYAISLTFDMNGLKKEVVLEQGATLVDVPDFWKPRAGLLGFGPARSPGIAGWVDLSAENVVAPEYRRLVNLRHEYPFVRVTICFQPIVEDQVSCGDITVPEL